MAEKDALLWKSFSYYYLYVLGALFLGQQVIFIHYFSKLNLICYVTQTDSIVFAFCWNLPWGAVESAAEAEVTRWMLITWITSAWKNNACVRACALYTLFVLYALYTLCSRTWPTTAPAAFILRAGIWSVPQTGPFSLFWTLPQTPVETSVRNPDT